MDTGWIITISTVASAAIVGLLMKNFLPSYLNEKAKNLATKEDVAAITDELETAGLVTRYAIGGGSNLISRLTSVRALKRRERRAQMLHTLRLGLRPQPRSVPASRHFNPLEIERFGNCGEFATIKRQAGKPTPVFNSIEFDGIRNPGQCRIAPLKP